MDKNEYEHIKQNEYEYIEQFEGCPDCGQKLYIMGYTKENSHFIHQCTACGSRFIILRVDTEDAE